MKRKVEQCEKESPIVRGRESNNARRKTEQHKEKNSTMWKTKQAMQRERNNAKRAKKTQRGEQCIKNNSAKK